MYDLPTEEEVAAALAAVTSYLLAQESTADCANPAPASGWRISKVLLQQGFSPVRAPIASNWANLDRIRRGAPGFAGIVGY